MSGQQQRVAVRVQQADFELSDEYAQLVASDPEQGAVVQFVGRVRQHNQARAVRSMFLEHYPGMTEKSLFAIAQQAIQRWSLGRVRIVHRVGELQLGEQIVFVGASAVHRQQAFQAVEFMLDHLKTQAPFWKKEYTSEGEHWVDANHKDTQALTRWQ